MTTAPGTTHNKIELMAACGNRGSSIETTTTGTGINAAEENRYQRLFLQQIKPQSRTSRINWNWTENERHLGELNGENDVCSRN
jgi:hypothetical protein